MKLEDKGKALIHSQSLLGPPMDWTLHQESSVQSGQACLQQVLSLMEEADTTH